jgi:quercetin dioxygenase-like cupin family protein
MSDEHVFKNIELGKTVKLDEMVSYQEGQVVSRTLAQRSGVSLTLFAFEAGEGLSKHTASGDALVQVLEGRGKITLDEEEHVVEAGQSLVMPAGVPHALDADERFKMLLTVVKPA